MIVFYSHLDPLSVLEVMYVRNRESSQVGHLRKLRLRGDRGKNHCQKLYESPNLAVEFQLVNYEESLCFWEV